MAAAKRKKGKRRTSFIMTIVFITASILFIISIVALNKEITAYKREVSALESQCEKQEAENDVLQSMIDSGNQEEYKEQLARQNGYIKQGDRVYQDIASGE